MGLLSSRNTPFTPSELTPGHPPPPGRCPTFFGHLQYHNDFVRHCGYRAAIVIRPVSSPRWARASRAVR